MSNLVMVANRSFVFSGPQVGETIIQFTSMDGEPRDNGKTLDIDVGDAMSNQRSSTSRWRSLCHACRGLRVFVSREPNARIHVAIATIVCIAGYWLKITRTEWALLALTIALVLSTEVVNTAIEVLADRVTREHDENIKLAKDMSAAAVLITAGASVVVGLLIFGPKLIQQMIE